jgi:hypothetical protein
MVWLVSDWGWTRTQRAGGGFGREMIADRRAGKRAVLNISPDNGPRVNRVVIRRRYFGRPGLRSRDALAQVSHHHVSTGALVDDW